MITNPCPTTGEIRYCGICGTVMVPSFAVDEWRQIFHRVLVCPAHYRERNCNPSAVAILESSRNPMEVMLDWDDNEQSERDEFLSRCPEYTYYDRRERRY